jgi:release factor glutamine methyltransferase
VFVVIGVILSSPPHLGGGPSDHTGYTRNRTVPVAAEEEAAEFLSAAPDEATLEAWLRRREQGEPPSWITGKVLFCGQVLHMAPGVYVPRSQSEERAGRAATLLPDNGRALDLCTGVGAVAAYLLAQVPTAAVTGIDSDFRAAACARRNGVPTAVADLAEPLRNHRQFDVVSAVAPYVPTRAIQLLPVDVQRYEPRVGLDGGADGLNVVRQVIAAASRLLSLDPPMGVGEVGRVSA